jgi:hypothetical protein
MCPIQPFEQVRHFEVRADHLDRRGALQMILDHLLEASTRNGFDVPRNGQFAVLPKVLYCTESGNAPGNRAENGRKCGKINLVPPQ